MVPPVSNGGFEPAPYFTDSPAAGVTASDMNLTPPANPLGNFQPAFNELTRVPGFPPQASTCCRTFRAKWRTGTPRLPARRTASSFRQEGWTAASVSSTPFTWTHDGKRNKKNLKISMKTEQSVAQRTCGVHPSITSTVQHAAGFRNNLSRSWQI